MKHRTDKRPVRKVKAAGLGGIPVAALVVAIVNTFWPQLPDSLSAAIGALLAALVAYWVPAAPHEKRHTVHRVPDAS